MAEPTKELHQQCMRRFIDLANAMKDEGVATNVVSAGLMTASAVYTTYMAAGNEGGLTTQGVDKMVGTYRQHLQEVQTIRKQQSEQAKPD